jgi:hypothetical protein
MVNYHDRRVYQIQARATTPKESIMLAGRQNAEVVPVEKSRALKLRVTQQARGSKVVLITALCVPTTVLVTVEVDRAVLVTVVIFVTVAATVPVNTVTGDGITVLVWTTSIKFVSVMVEAGARTVCTTAGAFCTIVVTEMPSGPSRLARRARRASLAVRASLRRLLCLGGLVGLGVGVLDEPLGTGARDVPLGVGALDEPLVLSFAAGWVASAFFGAVLVQCGVMVDVEVMVVGEWTWFSCRCQ